MQTPLKRDSFSNFEFDFGDWSVYKWKKLYYDSSEATEYSIDVPPFDETPGSNNEVRQTYSNLFRYC